MRRISVEGVFVTLNSAPEGTPLNFRASLVLLLALPIAFATAQTVVPRHQEGRLHGFLVVRTLDGRQIGYGEVSQSAHGDRVDCHVTYRFRDGSVDEETSVFSSQNAFTLISDHHIQRGPLFSHPIDLTTDAAGNTTSRTVDSGGKAKVETSHVDLPPGTAVVGMLGTLMANVDPAGPGLTIPALSPTQKPRLIHFAISREGRGSFHIAGSRQTAEVFRVKTDLGGVAGLVAPLIGKAPDDLLLWMLEGDAPSLVRAITQLSEGGPLLDLQFAGATFPRPSAK